MKDSESRPPSQADPVLFKCEVGYLTVCSVIANSRRLAALAFAPVALVNCSVNPNINTGSTLQEPINPALRPLVLHRR